MHNFIKNLNDLQLGQLFYEHESLYHSAILTMATNLKDRKCSNKNNCYGEPKEYATYPQMPPPDIELVSRNSLVKTTKVNKKLFQDEIGNEVTMRSKTISKRVNNKDILKNIKNTSLKIIY